MEKILTKKNIVILIGIIVLIGYVIFSISTIASKIHKDNENTNLIEALQDSLIIRKGENGEYIARISVLETENVNNFLKLSFKDEELKKLQEEVNKYKKQLKDYGSVTIVETTTKIDSIWEYHPLGGDTIIFSKSILTDSIVNPWINVEFGFDNGNSVFNLRKLTNRYTVVVGQENNGWFKAPTPFVELISYNPYTTINNVRTYQVSLPREKKIGLGIHVGYGLGIYDNKIILAPNLSIGVNYNILEW